MSYLWDLFFHSHLHFYRHTSSFAYFLEYVLLFLDDNVDEEYMSQHVGVV